MNKSVLADLQICISVPLIEIAEHNNKFPFILLTSVLFNNQTSAKSV